MDVFSFSFITCCFPHMTSKISVVKKVSFPNLNMMGSELCKKCSTCAVQCVLLGFRLFPSVVATSLTVSVLMLPVSTANDTSFVTCNKSRKRVRKMLIRCRMHMS